MPYANIEDRRRNSRDNYQRNKEKRLAYAKAYRESHKDKIRDEAGNTGNPIQTRLRLTVRSIKRGANKSTGLGTRRTNRM